MTCPHDVPVAWASRLTRWQRARLGQVVALPCAVCQPEAAEERAAQEVTP